MIQRYLGHISCLFGRHQWTNWVQIEELHHFVRHCGCCPMTHLKVGDDR